jgi:hypothetical protein
MGPIDLSRFPPMQQVCPDVSPGDIILCDFLTWHYSLPAENDEERVMIQLNYQPAVDPSSTNIVAGQRPHDKTLYSRFDAVSVPSIELNRPKAEEYWRAGELDRAVRFARGLVTDDPEHAGAALLLYRILAADKDPAAPGYLEMAQAAVARMQAQIAVIDAEFGRAPAAADQPAAPQQGDSPWRPVEVFWGRRVDGYDDVTALPATVGTPALAWDYGAVSKPIATDHPATIRIRARALDGRIGLALLSEDHQQMASEEHLITPESGDATVMIAFDPQKSPACLVVRNGGDDGKGGAVRLDSVEMIEFV